MLAPNVTVPAMTAMARAALRIADRTGTVSRRTLGSTAKRIPRTACTGNPATVAARRIREPCSRLRTCRRPTRADASRIARTTATIDKAMINTITPRPSTAQSTLMPGVGSTRRTGPSGANGDRATATAKASTEPTTTAPRTPTSPSVEVIAGVAPSARNAPMSLTAKRSCRPITCAAIKSVANPAMQP